VAAIRIFVTFNLVAFAWIFFRAASFGQASLVVMRLVHGPLLAKPPVAFGALPPFTPADVVLGVLLIAFLEFVQWAHAGRHLAQVFDSKPRWIRWPAYYALIVTILCIGQLGARSFIYFQF
jgi:alginate O-acetyltransferase complex protein AlgI